MSSTTEIVTLYPGQLLQLQVGIIHSKPVYSEYTHDEIISLLTRKHKKVSRKGNKPSRQIGLMIRAIMTGKWSTGAAIDKAEMLDRLIKVLQELPKESILCLTPSANESLSLLLNSAHCPTEKAFTIFELISLP